MLNNIDYWLSHGPSLGNIDGWIEGEGALTDDVSPRGPLPGTQAWDAHLAGIQAILAGGPPARSSYCARHDLYFVVKCMNCNEGTDNAR